MITNAQQVYDWALKRKSVFIEYRGSCWGGIKPASWVISMQARTLCRLISNGHVYYCVKKEDFDD
jgi:hypothetical protein